MRVAKVVASAVLATAAVAATVAPASAAGKPFHAPERITVQKLTAPATVVFSYRCKPGMNRTLNIGLTAPGTEANLWVEGKRVVCNNRMQQITVDLTGHYQFGLDRKIEPGEKATTWLSLYEGRRFPVAREMRELTAR